MLDSECTSTLSLIDDDLARSLSGIVRGIEKEGLRVTPSNNIAQNRHPEALGSTLTHPSITTDYSEALLEFITPTSSSVEDTVAYLSKLHAFTLKNIPDETIWPASMPCRIAGESSIPIALYGTSNVGRLKHVYRRGLGVRYGRIMQSIAGIHYNFSLSDAFWVAYQKKVYAEKSQEHKSLQEFKSANYFSLIRNFRRYSWILHYLFGASPVLDKSFFDERTPSLERISEHTYGSRYATSLRMSDLGYQNSAQEELRISYSSLDDYVTTLGKAMHHAHPPYDDIGVKDSGEFRQLNTNILQIENEYYSDIRPKRVTKSGEKPIAALSERGVEYIEVRILDINPFLAEGISAEQIRFLDAFLLHCLFSQCPEQSDTRCQEIRANQTNVIMRGRDPSLELLNSGVMMPFKVVSNDLLEAIMKTAKLLDTAHNSNEYSGAVLAQQQKVDDSQLTPSGKMMAMVENGQEFVDVAKQQADSFREHFLDQELDSAFDARLEQLAAESLVEQAQLEDSDEQSFEEFLTLYNAN